MRRVALPLLVLAVLALGPATAAAPPQDAETLASGTFTLAHWTLPTEAADANATYAPGGSGQIHFAVRDAGNATTEGNATSENTTAGVRQARVTLSSEGLAFANATLGNATLLLTVPQGGANDTWESASVVFTIPADAADGPAAYRFTVDYFEEGPNGTIPLATLSGQGSVAVVVPAPPEAPGVPLPVLVGGGAAVVVGAGAAILAMRRRRERELMNAAPRRSQVMRELELERQLEKVEEKEPERAQEIKQEIRAQEQVREKRRELQILEAKRADVLKTMDLLQKRHQAGGLTKLQYDNMVAKKQADLQRIEAEIAEMEAQDQGGAAAS